MVDLNCRLPIADCRFRLSVFNLQSAIGNLQFRFYFLHNSSASLVVIEPLAGLGVEGDHLSRLQLAAGHDVRRIDAEHARLAGDVEPAALVRTPAHRPQAHAIDGADEHLAVGRK